MGKQSGLGDNLYIDGYDLSGDIMALNKVGGGPSPLDMTAINKSAYERIGGLRDGGIDATSFFNPGPAANAAHLVLKTLPTTDRQVMYCRGTTLGSPAACCIGKQLNYDGKRAQSGEYTFAVQAVANGFGLEWGKLLTAGLRTDTVGTSGTGVDMGPGSGPGFTGPANFGAQFYLQVTAFTGTSVTVKIQESADNGGTDPWTDTVGGGFTAATAIGTQRLQLASNQTVKEWLRVVTTGTFTSATFAVMATRNDQAVVF